MPRHVLTLPYQRPPLSLNDRRSRFETARLTAQIRRDVGWLAKAAKIGPQDHITVWLEWTPKTKRGRDTDNPILTVKAAVDALVDIGIVPDDAPDFVTRPETVIHPADPKNPGLRLVIDTGRTS